MADPDIEKIATKEEQKRLDAITDTKVLNSSISILEFLDDLEHKPQYMSVADFKKYLPLFSKAEHDRYLNKNGDQSIDKLSSEYFSKVNPYKELTIVDSLSSKNKLATMPPALIAARPIDDGDQISNYRLNEANRMTSVAVREDIVQQGHKEYLTMLKESATTEEAVREFAEARKAVIDNYKELDALRDAYYKKVYQGVDINTTDSKSPTSNKLEIEEDDELYD